MFAELVIARLDRAIHAMIYLANAMKWITRSSRVMTKFQNHNRMIFLKKFWAAANE
jgi:hypothetical protein